MFTDFRENYLYAVQDSAFNNTETKLMKNNFQSNFRPEIKLKED